MRARSLAAAIVLILSLTVPQLSAEAAGGRVALVVGMSGYRHAPLLENPANDAKDMSAALGELGFEVTLSADADKAGFEAAIRAFSKRIAEAEAGLVFFAGHGVQVAGQNYLVPIDARLESVRDLEFDTVRLELILGLMESGRDGKVNIVMLDACRDNPLTRNLARSMGVRSDCECWTEGACAAGREGRCFCVGRQTRATHAETLLLAIEQFARDAYRFDRMRRRL
jgi:hypothetical protein